MKTPFLFSCLLAASFGTLLAQPPEFIFENGALTIRTDRFEVVWENGGMTSMKSFLAPNGGDLTRSDALILERFPNGPSLRAQADDGSIPEYHPWYSRAIEQCNFRVNQNPTNGANVFHETTIDGARLIYSELGDNQDITWTQEFRVDPRTGDLVISQRASAPAGGLSGISFAIHNLDASAPLAVPAFPGNGQVWRGDYGEGKFLNIAYPRFWSAGIVIGMIPSGGSFAVWSDDPNFMPKYFRHFTDGQTRTIGFEASLTDPYEKNTDIAVFDWRFNTFAGNWTEPALTYREHLKKIHDLKPLSERSPAWANELAMIWSTGGGSAEDYAEMAAKIDPAKVVLWDFSGSTIKPGINEDVPDYIPSDRFIQRNAEARAAGFHIASYYSMALVDVHAHPQIMKEYGLGFFYDALGGSRRTDAGDERLIYIHPGSPQWREFYSKKMRQVFDSYGVDVLYQDVAGTAVGSSGMSGGMNFNQAVVAADRAIHNRVPEALLAGEYWNEVTIASESIGLQRSIGWGGKDAAKTLGAMDMPHPICSLLFSPFSYYFAYKVPQLDTEQWHYDQNINEVIGSLPDWRTMVNDSSPEAQATLERAKLWERGFKPHFPEKWEKDVASYMRRPDGSLVRYRHYKDGSFCTLAEPEAKEKLLYARVSGTDRLEYPEPIHIPDWPAYDKGTPIALDPARHYCVFPGEPDAAPVTVTHVAEGAHVTTYRKTDDYILIGFNKPMDENFSWSMDSKKWTAIQDNSPDFGCLLATRGAARRMEIGEAFELDDFHYLTTLQGVSMSSQERPRIIEKQFKGTPLQTVQILPPVGGRDSEAVMEALVTLPEAPNLQLAFFMGRRGGAGDGVHIVVRVNGREIWRMLSPSEPLSDEQYVPLQDFAGKTVLLGIGVDAGPHGYNGSNDETYLGNIRLVSGAGLPPQTSSKGEATQESNRTRAIEDETYR